MSASVCLQSQQTATKLNVTSFQIEKEKQGSNSGALKQVINAVKQPIQEKTPWSCPVHDITAKAENRENEGIPNLWGLWQWDGERSIVNRSELPEQWSQKLSAWPGIIQGIWKQERSFLLIRYGTNKRGWKLQFFLPSFRNKSHAQSPIVVWPSACFWRLSNK